MHGLKAIIDYHFINLFISGYIAVYDITVCTNVAMMALL